MQQPLLLAALSALYSLESMIADEKHCMKHVCWSMNQPDRQIAAEFLGVSSSAKCSSWRLLLAALWAPFTATNRRLLT
jgi:hypothetical protein